jgi:hypothetical protein
VIRIILLLAVPLVVVAAPVPVESDSEKVARLWGKVESPPGKYVAKPNGTTLTLRSLGWPLGFGYGPPQFRITREVTGDFDMRVKVVAVDAPSRSVQYGSDGPQIGAGLFVESGECTLSLYHWLAIHRDQGRLQEGMQDCIWLAHSEPTGGGGSYLVEAEACRSVDLRIVRQGETITVHVANDGTDWKKWPAPGNVKLANTVTVGVFLGHTTYQECQATFADFHITKPKKLNFN